MGPQMKRLSRKDEGYQYVLQVCVVKLTRWIALIPLRNLRAAEVVDAILTNTIPLFKVGVRPTIKLYERFDAKSPQIITSYFIKCQSLFPFKTAIAERYICTTESYLKKLMDERRGRNKLARNFAVTSIFAQTTALCNFWILYASVSPGKKFI